jgi:hypothetical protein
MAVLHLLLEWAKLKELLLFGLDRNPTSLDLLLDLGFFNEFNQILEVVIKRYIKACRLETNKENFMELVNMFYFDTSPYGYDVFVTLQQLYNKGDIKKDWLDSLKKSIEYELTISLADKADTIQH